MDDYKDLDFEPYCIKMFMQRWYVLGHFHRDATNEKSESDYFGVFSFDRIMEMHLMEDVKFTISPQFNADDFFNECMGVIVGDQTEAEKIVIRAYGEERYYLRDLPLHHSQKEIGGGEDYADFEYYLRPTTDFRMAMLSRGKNVKILEPKALAEQIKKEMHDALKRYEL